MLHAYTSHDIFKISIAKVNTSYFQQSTCSCSLPSLSRVANLLVFVFVMDMRKVAEVGATSFKSTKGAQALTHQFSPGRHNNTVNTPRLAVHRPQKPHNLLLLHTKLHIMAEKEGSAVPPQAKGSWGSFLKVRWTCAFPPHSLNARMLT